MSEQYQLRAHPGTCGQPYLPVELWYFRERIWNLLPSIRHEPVQNSKHQAAHLHSQLGKLGHRVLNLHTCITIEVVTRRTTGWLFATRAFLLFFSATASPLKPVKEGEPRRRLRALSVPVCARQRL